MMSSGFGAARTGGAVGGRAAAEPAAGAPPGGARRVGVLGHRVAGPLELVDRPAT
jgi:hypothetical protein